MTDWNAALDKAIEVLETEGLPKDYAEKLRSPLYLTCNRDEAVAFSHADYLIGKLKELKK